MIDHTVVMAMQLAMYNITTHNITTLQHTTLQHYIITTSMRCFSFILVCYRYEPLIIRRHWNLLESKTLIEIHPPMFIIYHSRYDISYHIIYCNIQAVHWKHTWTLKCEVASRQRLWIILIWRCEAKQYNTIKITMSVMMFIINVLYIIQCMLYHECIDVYDIPFIVWYTMFMIYHSLSDIPWVWWCLLYKIQCMTYHSIYAISFIMECDDVYDIIIIINILFVPQFKTKQHLKLQIN